MSSVKILSQTDARILVAGLTSAAERLEAGNDPAWYKLALAAATLEALRLGLLAIEATDHAPCEGSA